MYGTIIVLDISCGCECWAFSLWEEHVFRDGVLRRTLGIEKK
jgi:hypothetical protein